MRDALAYEWKRITTVRSTYWMIGLTWFFVCGLAALLAIGLGSDDFSELPTGRTWEYLTTVVITAGGSVFSIPVLSAAFCGVMGAMAFGHEYRHGTIKQTLLAVPDRTAVFVAKLLVVAVWVVTLSVGIMLLNLGSAALFMDNFEMSKLALRPMLMFALYNLGFAWVGMGLAMILRNLAGALVAVLVWPYAVEPIIFGILRFGFEGLGNLSKLINVLPASAARRTMFAPYDLFANGLGAGEDLIDGVDVWSLGPSIVVMWAGVLLTLGLALGLFLKRDA